MSEKLSIEDRATALHQAFIRANQIEAGLAFCHFMSIYYGADSQEAVIHMRETLQDLADGNDEWPDVVGSK